jgi:hypothetical protein
MDCRANPLYSGWLPKAPKVRQGESLRGFFIKFASINGNDLLDKLRANEPAVRAVDVIVKQVSESASIEQKLPLAEVKFKLDPVKLTAATEIKTESVSVHAVKHFDDPFRIGVYRGGYNLSYMPTQQMVSIGYSSVW